MGGIEATTRATRTRTLAWCAGACHAARRAIVAARWRPIGEILALIIVATSRDAARPRAAAPYLTLT